MRSLNNNIIEMCPFCNSENFIPDNKKFICKNCGKSFLEPKERFGMSTEYKAILTMISDEPTVDTQKITAFLASSTALENERSVITTKIAMLNGQDLSTYMNLYHCEFGDKIMTDGTSQQDEYNRRIDSCDLFLLLIDNSEIGSVTLQEAERALEAKKTSNSQKLLSVFVRTGTPDGGENNLRWQKFIAEHKKDFDIYLEYNDYSGLERCTDKLYSYAVSRHIGTVLTKCSRYSYNIFLTGTEGHSDEFIYAIGDRFNIINNEMFEENEDCSFFFNLIISDPTDRIPDNTFDYYFIVRKANENIKEKIKFCYDRNDPNVYLDVNIFAGEKKEETAEIISEISAVINNNYPFIFATREKLDSNAQPKARIKELQEQFQNLLEGIKEYKGNDYYHARKLLMEAADFHFIAAYFFLGIIYSDKEGPYYNAVDAEKYYRLAADNDSPAAQCNLALMLYESGRLEEAEKYYRLAADNDMPEAQNDLGILLNKAGKTKEAEKYLRLAAEKNIPESQCNLGNLLDEAGKTKEAEKYYRLAADNGYTPALYNHGILLEETGRLEEAEKYYRLAADDGYTQAQFNLAILLEGTGRLEEAEKYYRLAADNEDTQAQNNLGILLDKTGKLEEAEKCYRIAADNEDTQAQFNLGILLEETGRSEEAEKYYRLAADNGYTQAQYNLGVLLEETGRGEEAEKYYRLAADNGDTAAQSNLGVLLYETGRLEEAEKYYCSAADKGNIIAQSNLGIMLEEIGRHEEAEKYLRLAADNGHVKAQCNLGVMFYENGKINDAEKYLRLAADNGDTTSQYNMWELLTNNGRPEEAEKYLRLAADNGDKDAQLELVSILRSSNNAEEAEKYEKMASLNNN